MSIRRSVAGASAGALAAALLALLPAPARAYEDEATLGVSLGYGYAAAERLPHHAALVGAFGTVGLSDVWTVRGDVSYAIHPDGDAPPTHVAIVGAELQYVIDVLKYVPYFGVGPDAFGRLRDGELRLDLAFHATFGVDYLVSRTLSVGFDVRGYVLASHISTDPFEATATLHVASIFEL